MTGLFSRQLDATRSVLLVSSDSYGCSIVEDALYEWGYVANVVFDPTQAIQELHRHRPEIVVLDLESLDELGRELGDMIQQSLLESDARIVLLKASHGWRANRREDDRADAVLTKPFDCGLLRMSLDPTWQAPTPGRSTNSSRPFVEHVASVRNILVMPSAFGARLESSPIQIRARKSPRNCRGLLAPRKRSA